MSDQAGLTRLPAIPAFRQRTLLDLCKPRATATVATSSPTSTLDAPQLNAPPTQNTPDTNASDQISREADTKDEA